MYFATDRPIGQPTATSADVAIIMKDWSSGKEASLSITYSNPPQLVPKTVYQFV